MRYTIQVDQELQRAFLETCRDRNRMGAQVLRDFMTAYVARFGQQSLPLESESERDCA